MNLKELKKMIKEEYSAYTEQAEPAVDVAPGDVDAGGDDDSEATLRQIYDMLKDYFEGDKEPKEPKAPKCPGGPGGPGGPAGGPPPMMDAPPMDMALQERFKKLANIIKG